METRTGNFSKSVTLWTPLQTRSFILGDSNWKFFQVGYPVDTPTDKELHPWRLELEIFPSRLPCGHPYREVGSLSLRHPQPSLSSLLLTFWDRKGRECPLRGAVFADYQGMVCCLGYLFVPLSLPPPPPPPHLCVCVVRERERRGEREREGARARERETHRERMPVCVCVCVFYFITF